MKTEVHGADVPVSQTVMSSAVTWETIEPVDCATRIGPGPAWAHTVCPVIPRAGDQSGPASP
ncbi:MAG: hypothetical protein V9E82_14660 [Candidatus Nanopelagicales bacterium]